jgi:hypothetical protein
MHLLSEYKVYCISLQTIIRIKLIFVRTLDYAIDRKH